MAGLCAAAEFHDQAMTLMASARMARETPAASRNICVERLWPWSPW